ncbi:hypothetical protein VTL71DRAFT_686 [Oculimacula yallundae]|uniref:Uncharacterized protein n=1 Tax=Oculimacula yallundae TaxID=86028 RepID=A0ABR4D291_9HELO
MSRKDGLVHDLIEKIEMSVDLRFSPRGCLGFSEPLSSSAGGQPWDGNLGRNVRIRLSKHFSWGRDELQFLVRLMLFLTRIYGRWLK